MSGFNQLIICVDTSWRGPTTLSVTHSAISMRTRYFLHTH